MREQTILAKGTFLKAGATRRIAITMEESLFLELKKAAVANDRSISHEAIRRLRRSLSGVRHDN